jgi:hypothetical protein
MKAKSLLCMKKFLLLPIAIITMLCSCEQQTYYEKARNYNSEANTAILDNANGYKALKLGMHLDSIKGILNVQLDEPGQDLALYAVKESNLIDFSVDGAVASDIEAWFLNNHLYMIQIRLEGEDNSYPFYKAISEAYGPVYPTEDPETYKWEGKEVELTYEVDKLSRNGIVKYSSISLGKVLSLLQQSEDYKQQKVAAEKLQ